MELTVSFELATAASIIFAVVTQIYLSKKETRRNNLIMAAESIKEVIQTICKAHEALEKAVNEIAYNAGSGSQMTQDDLIEMHKILSGCIAKLSIGEYLLRPFLEDSDVICRLKDDIKRMSSSPELMVENIRNIKKAFGSAASHLSVAYSKALNGLDKV